MDAIRHSIVVAGWCVCVCIVSLIIVHCAPFVVPLYISDIMKIKCIITFLKLNCLSIAIQFLDTVLTFTATNFNMTSTK